MNGKQLRYPSKAKFLYPPTKLAEAIEAINLMSSEIDERYKEVDSWEIGLTGDWTEFFKSLPEKVRNFVVDISERKVFARPLEKDDDLALYEAFQDFLFFRHLLASLLEMHEKAVEASSGNSEGYIKIMKAEFRRLVNPDTNQFRRRHVVESEDANPVRRFDAVLFEFSSDSIFDFEAPPLLKILKKVDFKRIRECPYCKDIFWAKRADAIGCSTRCSNALRQRKSRDKKKDSNG